MKIHILHKFQDGPWGGGNQFLKVLMNQFKKKNVYTDDISEADVILFNSHQHTDRLVEIKNKYPNKTYVHRIDGPMKLYNNMDDKRDSIVYRINSLADANIFQSEWSHKANLKMGFVSKVDTTIITNASDSNIFNKQKVEKNNDKFRLIATSWSPNVKKGFKYYDFLDKNLDFEKYEFYFVGNSPFLFKNIKTLGICSSYDLMKEMKSSDAYITASECDPCSNSLIEALSCGIPVIALNSGGHPELVKNGGYLFQDTNDLIETIEMVFKNMEICKQNIEVKSMEEVGSEYINFIKEVANVK